MIKSQKVWFDKEGDAWFERNKEHLGKKKELILLLLDLFKIKPKRVVEIGCANGYRLAKLHKKYNCEVIGVECSKKAIKDGKSKWPYIRFIRATCEFLKIEENADLVIINFVFHWIARDILLKCVAKIDDSLKNEGYLIIGDFGTEYFFKRKYHHLENADFYTWKMQYWELFTKSGKYLELAKLRFNHDTGMISPDINIDNMGTIVLLRKQDLYVER